MDWSLIAAKILGGVSGSSIVVVFRTKKMTARVVLAKMWVGCVFGFVFCAPLVAFLGWERSVENLTAAAAFLAMLSYPILRYVLSEEFERKLHRRIDKVVDGEESDKEEAPDA